MFKLVFFLLLIGISLASCDNCRQCLTNKSCAACLSNYALTDGNCHLIGIGTGAVVGIVIGCVVGGAILVLGLLCLIVWCSETVEQRLEIVEAATADTYYLPPSHQALVPPTSSVSVIQTPSQIVPSYVNQYPGYPQVTQMMQLQQATLLPPQMQQSQQKVNQFSIKNSTLQNRDTCTICITSQTNIKLSPCGHQFHVKCLVGWINKKKRCPNCNAHNIQALVACNRCGNFNQNVTFCATGCQKPNHYQCFVLRNSDKLTCRNCIAGQGRVSYPSIIR